MASIKLTVAYQIQIGFKANQMSAKLHCLVSYNHFEQDFGRLILEVADKRQAIKTHAM